MFQCGEVIIRSWGSSWKSWWRNTRVVGRRRRRGKGVLRGGNTRVTLMRQSKKEKERIELSWAGWLAACSCYSIDLDCEACRERNPGTRNCPDCLFTASSLSPLLSTTIHSCITYLICTARSMVYLSSIQLSSLYTIV